MVRTNRQILTGGKKYVQKQAKRFGTDEVTFDKDSRAEYLTGFHKRKVARQKKAQEFHKEQERLTRIEERKRLREERKQDLESQLQKFNDTIEQVAHLDSDGGSGEEADWKGFEEGEEKPDENDEDDDEDDKHDQPKGILRRKVVYEVDPETMRQSEAIIDDETTVTVEAIDNPLMANLAEASLEARAKANYVNLQKADEVLKDSIKRAQNYAVVAGVSKPSAKDRVKKKKFRYLTKNERRDNNRKVKEKKNKHKEKRS